MAIIKTIDLLPIVFRSDSNKKFLSATLDQLVSEPNFQRVNGYIGRQFAPTYKAGDSYITEPDKLRQNYQLEPSVVIRDDSNNILHYSNYRDLLNQLKYHGANVTNHDRLFANEQYNFDGLIDFDKFINFSQYYWLPSGPPEVTVTGSNFRNILNYDVKRDTATNSFKFTGFSTDGNPLITLVRGNTYTFNVNSSGNKFWIQTRPGVSGTRSIEAEINERDVLGVQRNGTDIGEVRFSVPRSDAQDFYARAPLATNVDFAINGTYRSFQSNLLNVINSRGGFDGIIDNIANKTLIFLTRDETAENWTDPGNFDLDKFDQGPPVSSAIPYEAGNLVPAADRYQVWLITLVDVGAGRRVVRLIPRYTVNANEKVYVREGKTNAGLEYVKNRSGNWEEAPNITAPLDTLYYQDSKNPLMYGTIKLIDPNANFVDVTTEIIGKKNYTSPNGIVFTNGLRVTFDTTATPAAYTGNSYIVEGVGRAIKLISATNLIVPEGYAETGLTQPDYITVNRASTDQNPWSRSNRWFHNDLIKLSATYNNTPSQLLVDGLIRATRPIIEFDPDIKLYNFGTNAKAPIDIIDFTVTDAFNQVEGKSSYTVKLPGGQAPKKLTEGTRIIFANDVDPDVRNRIYNVTFITTDTGTQIHLVSQNTTLLPTFKVDSIEVVDSKPYTFVPTVTLTAPLPGLGEETATAQAIMSNTTVASFNVLGGGTNYIAPPAIEVATEYDVRANTIIQFDTTKKIDFIRITEAGTGYSTIPTITITHPEAVVRTNANTAIEGNFLKMSSGSVAGVVGNYVIGEGMPGGSIVSNVNVSDNNIGFSIRTTVTTSGNEYVFKPLATLGVDYHVQTTTEVFTAIITLDDTSLAHEGMYVSGPRIPYGTEVLRVLGPTQIEISREISTAIGDKVVFVGRRATATPKVDGGRILAVTVNYPGAGYTSTPSYTVSAPASGPTATFSLVMSDLFIRYITFDSAGSGYQLTANSSVNILNSVTAFTSTATVNGVDQLEFATANEISSVGIGWRCFYVIKSINNRKYGDFTLNSYTDRTITGPELKGTVSTYRDYMDIALTSSTVYTVTAVDSNTITLDKNIEIRDEDGNLIDLPVGSELIFTCQNRYFTDDLTGSGSPVGDQQTYQTAIDIDGSTTVTVKTAQGLQPGMLISDEYGTIPDGIKIISVDYINNSITVSSELRVSANTPFRVSQSALVKVTYQPSTIDSIIVTAPGRGYTSAPLVTVQPTVDVVTVVGEQVETTDSYYVVVESLVGILVGSRVTSDYDGLGIGITVGDTIPEVQELITTIDAVGTETYKVRLDVLQPPFISRNITFTYASEAIARVAPINNVDITSTDTTPDTYEAGNNVLLTTPTNIQQLITDVPVYHEYWYNGTSWQPGQQKTGYTQSPLFDIFNDTGVSVTDVDSYPGSKFVGTQIFGYKTGTGANDSVLGIPLSYRNFQAVGDIQFQNYWDTDQFNYLTGTTELTVPVNNFYLKETTVDGLVSYRNIWRKTSEQTHQYQVINHVFDDVTNYFEIDVLPIESLTVPYIKVYLNNTLLSENSFSIESVGARTAVVIEPALLSTGAKVDIRIYSNSISKLGYYEIPSNLDNNSSNSNFEVLTLGQMRNHYTTMAENNYGLDGIVLGSNNVRDIDIKSWAGSILQHASPIPLANVFLLQREFNLVEAVELAQKEYTKFKNRFLELAIKQENTILDIPRAVDTILEQMNAAKSIYSPWYDSDMLPWSAKYRTELLYPIINVQQRIYQIPTFYDDKLVSNRAVLVYLTNKVTGENQLLVKDIDYSFSTTTAGILLSDSLLLTVNNVLKVLYFNSTEGNYVPETPTKLGLYPKFKPQIFEDTSYQNPVRVIQGHDGSLTPVFNDFRDQMLLEIETRIYNNIKVNYAENIFDLYEFVPGKFRKTAYDRKEFTRVLTKNFLKWLGTNQVDYADSSFFQSNNAWTWNYKKLKDRIDGENLPGFWRGIYQYFYDTDRPNLMPWEMLGFSERPDWWVARYGNAPYTGGNNVLWADLEQGYIYSGSRAGIDLRFARPGLSKIIPVDEYGQLISPEKLFPKQFNGRNLSGAFAIGDQAPAETAWRRSSDFPYAMQIALMLTNPAYYFGSLVNTHAYYRDPNVDQLVVRSNKQRLTKDTIEIPNVGANGDAVVHTSGYINWVRDFLVNRGIDPAPKIKSYLKNVSVNLSYATAGFADKNYLNVLAEQGSPTYNNESVIIPDENYEVYLHKSAPVNRAVYSAVIIEKGETGWKVSGYDLANPYFTIVPSEAQGRSYQINVAGAGATIYRDYRSVKITVPYGHEFSSRQQVVDFLVAHGRYMISQGFVFDTMNNDMESKQDWVLSAKEFLTWSQQGWQSGNILVLSPAFNNLKVQGAMSVVDFVENRTSGSKVLDQNFQIIRNNQFSITRSDNVFTFTANFGQTIGYAEFNLVQYEHILVFDNETVFNDVIYKPAEGIRQFRFKLVGNKTGNWTGALNPPGFMYNSTTIQTWKADTTYKKGDFVDVNGIVYLALIDIDATQKFEFSSSWQEVNRKDIKTGLLPNFASLAQKFENIYDVDNLPAAEDQRKFSNGLIGFRQRQFFSDFSLSDESQVKFYQGYITQKGTLDSITALTRATFNNITSNIEVFEEWAIRVGEYGALDSDQSVEVLLKESQLTDDPTTLILLDNADDDVPGAVSIRTNDMYQIPVDYSKNIIPTRTSYQPQITDFVTAGYVNLGDIDGTIFDIQNFSELVNVLPDIGSGYKLWVAKDFSSSWNVYRVTETNNLVTSLTYNLDNFMIVGFDNPHDFIVGEVLGIKGFDADFDGFYQVIGIDGLKSILTVATRNIDILKSAQTITDTGVLFRLKSVRFNLASDINNFTPPNGWKDADRVWIDNNDAINSWAVYQKANAWKTVGNLTLRPGEYTSDEGYGRAVSTNFDNTLLMVGSPFNNPGQVAKINISNPGQNYGSTVVSFSYPDRETGGVRAQGSAIIESGTILQANVVTGGSGFRKVPTVTLSDFSNLTSTSNKIGSVYVNIGSTATLRVLDRVTSANIANVSNTVITEIMSATNVRLNAATTISNGNWVRFDRGTNANILATLTPTSIASITIVDGGAGYVTSPAIEIIGGGGSGAIANAVVTGGVITACYVINGGAGYTEPPTVRIISPTVTTSNLVAVLTPTSVASLNIINKGLSVENSYSGYTSNATIAITAVAGDSGIGATGNLRVSYLSIGSIEITVQGQGYLEPPSVAVTDLTGVGTGFAANAVLTTGVVKTFLRNKETLAYSQIDTIRPFGPDAGDFGADIKMGTYTGAIGAPGSFADRGTVTLFQFAGGVSWNTQQILQPTTTNAGARFGESIAMSKDENWLYVGAPGINQVYAYAQKQTSLSRTTITLATGASTYFINLPGATKTEEVSIIGDSGKVYQPELEFSLIGSTLSFVSLAVLARDTKLFISQLINTTTIRCNTLISTYALSSLPESVHAVTVIDSSGRIFVPETEYYLNGQNIVFRNTAELIAVSITIRPLLSYYVLMGTITPPEAIESSAQFGASLSTTEYGYQLLIGAPDASVNGVIRAGRAYAYDRNYELFQAFGNNRSFNARIDLKQVTRVTVDSIAKVENIDYTKSGSTIVFDAIPESGGLIRIDLNDFNLIQKFTPPEPVTQGRFGSSVTISDDNTGLFVGSPGYNIPGYYFGSVYRYINRGKVYGDLASTVLTASITLGVGDTIRINEQHVSVGLPSGEDFINQINAIGIPGVVATNLDGNLVITGDNVLTNNKLDILPSDGTVLADLGVSIYSYIQEIRHPGVGNPERFGSKIKIGDNSETLVISSEQGATLKITTFDELTTTFDKTTTSLLDSLKQAGAVYVYDFLGVPNDSLTQPSQFVFSQVLQNAYINARDNFGSSLDINKDVIIIGAEFNDNFGNNTGLVHIFTNPELKKSWTVTRNRTDKVDTAHVNKIFAYDTRTQTIVAQFDYVDPVKGKILGVADQDIDYKTVDDPATYNLGSELRVNIDSTGPWGDFQLGQVWWDLSTVKYIDYEQDTVSYRAINWGTTFPGSSIDVYEWVSSDFLPSQYVTTGGDGVPKHPADTAYVRRAYIDESTGLARVKYYFWVKNKRSITFNAARRTNSVTGIADLIANPASQDIPYLSFIQSNAFNVYNSKALLQGDYIALHIEYSKVQNSNIVHSEFQLVQQNNPKSKIPTRVINKIIDSISGEDSVGNIVPDLRLPAAGRVGLALRPRQTLILDNEAATKVFVSFVNSVFASYQVVGKFDLANMLDKETIPASDSGWYHIVIDTIDQLEYIPTEQLMIGTRSTAGFRVLVGRDSTYENFWTIYEWQGPVKGWVLIRIQSYDNSRYWGYVNWYATGYNDTVAINTVVNTVNDISTLNLMSGQIVKVLDNGLGHYEIYEIDSTLRAIPVISEKGTIKVTADAFDVLKAKIGFDNSAFDSQGFSKNAAQELRNIFVAIYNEIFVNDLQGKTNELFFSLVNYIFTEQRSLDWILKTSFLTVAHKLRKLLQFPAFIKDNQDYYQQYIDEVKPYRSQVREYVLNYEGVDESYSKTTDFDFYSYYDKAQSVRRNLDTNNADDRAVIRATNRSDWYNSYSYQIQTIVVTRSGSGYTIAPAVTITGGSGSGAKAQAILGAVGTETEGQIIGVELLNAGTGYTSTPVVEFAVSSGTGVSAYAKLSVPAGTVIAPNDIRNRMVRNISTKLKFDRVSYYATGVRPWISYTTYSAGQVITVNDQKTVEFANYPGDLFPGTRRAYLLNKNFLGASILNEKTLQDSEQATLLDGGYFNNANDRLLAYWQPGSTDLGTVFWSENATRIKESDVNTSLQSLYTRIERVAHSTLSPVGSNFVYMAVGFDGAILASVDGKHWVDANTVEISTNLRGVENYGGVYWVAVGAQAQVLLSENGLDWGSFAVQSFYYGPVGSGPTAQTPALGLPYGLTSENTQSSVDFTDITTFTSTAGTFAVAVGNNGTILINPFTTFTGLIPSWYSVTPQGLTNAQDTQYLRVINKATGYLADPNGLPYLVKLSTDGYYYLDLGGKPLLTGYMMVAGIQGKSSLIPFSGVDSAMQGYVYGYNYDSQETYPYTVFNEPTQVTGLGLGFVGEQVNGIAFTDSTDFVVMIGSGGTLLWNSVDTAYKIQNGTGVAADTVGRIIVDYQPVSYKNFKYFSDSEFAYPLKKEDVKHNFQDIVYDGEKFIVTGDRDIVLWGYPGTKKTGEFGLTSTTFININANIAANASVTLRSQTGNVTIQTAGVLSRGASTVTTANLDLVNSNYMITAINGNTSAVVGNVSFTGKLIGSAVTGAAQHDLVTFINPITSASFTLKTSLNSANGSSTLSFTAANLFYPNNTCKITTGMVISHANIVASISGTPALVTNYGPMVAFTNKEPAFTWKYAPGFNRNPDLDFVSTAINRNTIQLDLPLQANLVAGTTITFNDTAGDPHTFSLLSNVYIGGNIFAFLDLSVTSIVQPGWTVANTNYPAIQPNSNVISSGTYLFSGVRNRQFKDIPDNVPGTEYTGVKVRGTEFDDTIQVDTIMSSEFGDDALGIRAEDIVVDGGQFIDTYSSFAPQELIPGRLTDNLQISVFTVNPVDATEVAGYRISYNGRDPATYYRISAANTTTLAEDLPYSALSIKLTDVSGLPTPSPEQNKPGVLFVNGEMINYFTINRGNNTVGQIRRGVNRTGTPLIHKAGSLVTDSSVLSYVTQDVAVAITQDFTANNMINNESLFRAEIDKEIVQSVTWYSQYTG